MKYKNNINNLIKLKKEIIKLQANEDNDIKELLRWRKKLKKKSKIKTKLINLDECKDWYLDKNKNLYHKSGQFFKIGCVQDLTSLKDAPEILTPCTLKN